MKIQGHRGSKGTHPENTLSSFQEAIDAGADGIELDLRMQKDGTIVIHHDSLQRNKGPILSLKEFFFALKDQRRVVLNLELKETIGPNLLNLVKEFQFENRVYYSSFQLPLLKEIRNQDERAILGYIVDHTPNLQEIPDIDISILSPEESLLNRDLIMTLQTAGYRIIPWTVNNPRRAKELAEMGIDEIITDYPRLFKEGNFL